MTLGETISYYRKRAGMSQETLAEQVGVSRQSVSKWELDEATPEVGKLVTLAKTFGITTDQLLSGEAPEERPAQQAGEYHTPDAWQAGRGRRWSFLERMINRYGWVAGVYVALQGLGVALVGGIARFAFGRMLQAAVSSYLSQSWGMAVEVGGQWMETWDPNVLSQIYGVGQEMGMVTGVWGILIRIATVILVIGVAWMIAGIVLAVRLRRKSE